MPGSAWQAAIIEVFAGEATDKDSPIFSLIE